MKLLVIYIDCLDRRLVEHFETPFLSEVSFSRPTTPIPAPYPTGPSCATIYTGVPPAKHGMNEVGWVYGEEHFTSIRVLTVFDIIAEHGLSQVIYNMPITWPVREIPSASLIAGFPSFLASGCAPASLCALLPDWYKTDIIPEHENRIGRYDWREGVRLDWGKAELLIDLIDQGKLWGDVVFAGFQLVDRASHKMQDRLEALKA